MTEQPNILFIITDQQRADHAGFMGHPILRTPNIDRIAASGMVFDNAWVSNPVCMPNRSTIMTGRMPSAHGCVFNDRSLDWGVNTFVRQFRNAGYRTGLIGKSHLQHGISKNSMVPFRGASSGKSGFAPGWDEVEDFERYLEEIPDGPDDFYGFDHFEFSLDHGARIAGHHLLWALARGAAREECLIDQDADDLPGSDRSRHWKQVYRPPYPEELHSTAFVTERTIAFINEASAQRKPWLAWCSFPDPHHPVTPPGDWFDLYRPDEMILPESRHDPLDGAPKHLKLFASIHPKDQRNYVAPCGYGNDELLAETMAATFGAISMIDHGVGQIMACIEEQKQTEDTIIVFTSDHGDMMGDHSLFIKGFMHYRGTLQVPYVINAPGKTIGRTNSLASSIDLGPTLMDLCGIRRYDGLQGVSLAPILDDPAATARDHVLIEDDVPIVTSKVTPIPARTRTILKDGFKFSRNSKGEEQLFNLAADPDEMRDIRSEKDTRAHMLTALADAMMMADDSSRGAPAMES